MDKISMPSVLVCFFFGSFSIALACTPAPALTLAPALYVFGDSTLDPGNIVSASTIDNLPYGIDLPSKVSERLTNGFTSADFFAQWLGFGSSPSAYISYNSTSKDKIDGFNYACRGCGILDSTGVQFNRMWSLSEQVQKFNLTINDYLRKDLMTEEYLSNSIFLIGIGGNDYFLNSFKIQVLNPEVSIPFADQLVTQFGICLERLYKLGARKVVVNDIGPLGCSIMLKKENLTCVEGANAVARIYNDKLTVKLEELNSKLSNATFVLLKNYDVTYDMFVNPSKYGIKDTRHPCCQVSAFGGCVFHSEPCPNRDEYIFFDSAHTTQIVCKTVGLKCFNGTGVCDPNVVELAKK